MINEKDKLLGLIDDLKDYLNIKLRIVALNLGENTAQIIASIISNGAILFFVALFLLFGSFAIAFGLGSLLSSISLGFLLVASFYLLLALAVYLCRRSCIEKPMTNFFIKQFFKNTDPDDAED
jgi:ABC-type multidrug transport system fused ATPase/permease subunit